MPQGFSAGSRAKRVTPELKPLPPSTQTFLIFIDILLNRTPVRARLRCRNLFCRFPA